MYNNTFTNLFYYLEIKTAHQIVYEGKVVQERVMQIGWFWNVSIVFYSLILIDGMFNK